MVVVVGGDGLAGLGGDDGHGKADEIHVIQKARCGIDVRIVHGGEIQCGEQRGHRGRQGGIKDIYRGDIATVEAKILGADSRIPIDGLPLADAVGDGIGKVVVVGKVFQPETLLEEAGEGGIVCREDEVDKCCDFFRGVDAGSRRLVTDGLVVLPEVPYGLDDSR